MERKRPWEMNNLNFFSKTKCFKGDVKGIGSSVVEHFHSVATLFCCLSFVLLLWFGYPPLHTCILLCVCTFKTALGIKPVLPTKTTIWFHPWCQINIQHNMGLIYRLTCCQTHYVFTDVSPGRIQLGWACFANAVATQICTSIIHMLDVFVSVVFFRFHMCIYPEGTR